LLVLMQTMNKRLLAMNKCCCQWREEQAAEDEWHLLMINGSLRDALEDAEKSDSRLTASILSSSLIY
jgi:hypothetical protein